MIAILGAESDSGKTQIVAGLSYIFQEHNPLPFKAQNMSLNSYVGVDDGEMAFAQSWQAIAGGSLPYSYMNPVLLKPIAPGKTEIILFGKSIGTAEPKEYWKNYKKKLKEIVFDFFSELTKKHRIIFVEGAGSCSEINLKREDFANLELCRRFKIPFILVVDIDRGGAFAKIVGTYELMGPKEKDLFYGIIINKMSGDKSLLSDGIKFIEKKTKKKVIGVINFIDDLNLPEEDSMMFHRKAMRKARKLEKKTHKKILVKVIKTPYISNFFDLYPLTLDENFDLSWAYSCSELDGADIIVLAGSRNVFTDLKFIKDQGFDEKIRSEVKKGKFVIAICGGYEMLFEKIRDKWRIESRNSREIEGLGFVKGDVNFRKEKIVGWETLNVTTDWFCGTINGFNIRHGDNEIKYFSNENIFGCFLHNIFWNDDFISALVKKFGLKNKGNIQLKLKNELKKWANHLEKQVDLDYIKSIIL